MNGASFVHIQLKQLWVYCFDSYFDMSIAQNDLIIMFVGFLSIFTQFCSHYNMFVHSANVGKTSEHQSLDAPVAVAITLPLSKH